MSYRNSKNGLTLIEILFALGIFLMVVVLIGSFQKNIFFFNSITQKNLSAQMEGRRASKSVASDLRQASPSSLGAYPILQASSTSVTFYADTNSDGLKERIRYFLSGTDFRKGVVVPSGNPLTYNQANESITTLVSNVTNLNAIPVFEYFDTNYAGTSTPLTVPIDILSIRLVKLVLVIDENPDEPPPSLTITTQVTIRNIKDNL